MCSSSARLLFVAIFLLVSGITASASAQENSPQALSARIRELIKANKHVEARTELEKLLPLLTQRDGPQSASVATALGLQGRNYYLTQDYPQAEAALLRSLRILDALGSSDATTAMVLESLGEVYLRTREFAKQEAVCRRSLEIKKKVLGPQHLEVAKMMNVLGYACRELGRYDEEARLHVASLKIQEAQLGPDDLEVAVTLNGLAVAYRLLGRFKEAEPLYLRSYRIREAKLAPNDPELARAILGLATFYNDVADFAKAEALFLRCLKVQETLAGDYKLDLTYTLNSLASLYVQLARYDRAEPLLLRSLAIREQALGNDDPETIRPRSWLAAMYMSLGRHVEGERYFRQNLDICERKLGPDHPDTVHSLVSVAQALTARGRVVDALPLLTQSVARYEMRLGKDHPALAGSLECLAAVYGALGQTAEQRRQIERAVQLHEAALGSDHPNVAHCLHLLAEIGGEASEPRKAEQLQRRSLQILETKYGSEHPSVAAGCQSLARILEQQGALADALPLLERGLKIHQTKFPGGGIEVAGSQQALGWHYYLNKQYDLAIEHLQKAVRNFEASRGPHHPDLGQSGLLELGIAQAAAGNIAQSRDTFDRSRRIVHQHVATILPALGEREQLTFLNQKDVRHLHTALSLVLLNPQDSRLVVRSAEWLLNAKGAAQQVLAERSWLARENDSVTARELQKLSAVRGQLAAATFASTTTGAESAVQKRIAELAEQERALSARVAETAMLSRADSSWHELNAVRQKLGKTARLIDIARINVRSFKPQPTGEEWLAARYLAWIIPPAGTGEVAIVDLGDADQIDRAIEELRAATKEAQTGRPFQQEGERVAQQEYLRVLAAVSELVFRPLLSQLDSVEELVVSPDSALWLIPWAALPLAAEEFALERWRFRFVVSGRDLLASGRQVNANPPRILADPDYDLPVHEARKELGAILKALGGTPAGIQSPATLANVDLDFRVRSASRLGTAQRLPASAAEAAAITPNLQKYAGPPKVYARSQALEGVFKRLRSPRVLVLSTHGFFLSKDSLPFPRSADSTSAPPHESTTTTKPLENPLLQCGLLLAGCNRRQELAAEEPDDGVLTGMEIIGTDLRATELVVLSACETGLGVVQDGEGVSGLRQAFQLAGARSVVSTLWQVPDLDSAILMSEFFAQLAAGKSKAEALRQAQLQRIAVRRDKYGAAHPFFWAAWSLTGN